MTFYAYHGMLPEDKQRGQQFEVDVEVQFDISKAGQSDNLEDTVDVNQIYNIVEEVILEGEFNLLEAIAEHIAQALLDKLPITNATVRVRMPRPPIRGICGELEVVISRKIN